MAIWLTKDSKVLVQGITGSEGSKHTRRMLRAGTDIVGGTNPRKAGIQVDFDGTKVPVFATVAEAMAETGADTIVSFVPPAVAQALVLGAIEHGVIVNPLTLQGYPSIGCMPCTTPVADGEDARAGRWRGKDKTECGLHLA